MPSCKTCGFYDEAGEFSYLVGLPGKKWCRRRHSCSLSTALFSRSMEPKTEPEREFRYGHQGLELLTTQTQESIF